ncbi:MAG: AmpG family muropeptide MFS transporter [Alphaproteobacteria bacterium]|nr:AmpG family muropeptide MFS transporter [Alphaproteobacteria bacterium]
MGFSSGLPLALTGATLSIWLKDVGVSLIAIGFFALVGTVYTFKFLWSPIIDRAHIPVLTPSLGRRRSWALIIQIALAAAILTMGHADPRHSAELTALAAVLVAFCSASQDIVIDAYRVELLDAHEQGAGAAATQLGYRIGMLASGAGALFLAEFFGWQLAYTVMAGLVGIGMTAVLATREPREMARPVTSGADAWTHAFSAWIKDAVIAPFADFVQRRAWLPILLFVVLYKVGDAMAGVMAGPFYIAMGFSKPEIASVSKVFGVIATMTGVFLGGLVVYRLGVFKSLLICGVLQMLSNLMFAAQAVVGYDLGFLMATIAVENVTGGMGSAAFVAYLSSLCNIAFTATQYALLSSLSAVPRTVLASGSGWLAESLDWVLFFGVTTVAALPGLLLLMWLGRVIGMASTAPAGPMTED